MSQKSKGSKPRKEAYFVQVENPDKSLVFVNVSDKLGKQVEFTKPLATCALRVTDTAVLFSALKLFQRSRAALVEKPLSMPPGPLARLERMVALLPAQPADNELIVEFGDQRHVLTLTRDENNIVTLEMPGDADEYVFELPRTTLGLTMFLRSPRTARTIGVGWIGYQQKPGSPETLVRAAAYALNHLASVAEFQVIAGVNKVQVPPPPGRYTVARPVRRAEDEVRFSVPVRLWHGDEQPQQLAAGTVEIKVDLDNANPVNSRLLFGFAPADELAEYWEHYRARFEMAVSEAFSHHFGPDELTDLVCNIALGEVGAGDIDRLREAAGTITGFDMTPKQAVAYKPAA